MVVGVSFKVETYCCQIVYIVVRFRILTNNIHLIKIHVQIPFLLFIRWKKTVLTSTICNSSFKRIQLEALPTKLGKKLMTFSAIIRSANGSRNVL